MNLYIKAIKRETRTDSKVETEDEHTNRRQLCCLFGMLKAIAAGVHPSCMFGLGLATS